MATPKIETGLKETSMKSQDSGNTRKTKFEVFGEEIIEKEVKPSGNRSIDGESHEGPCSII
jgi:hypothetical protein